jgi:hypothetical protein
MKYDTFGLRHGNGWYNGFTPNERGKVGRWQNKQYAAGFPRPTECDSCGQTQGLIIHHCEDYGEPFGNHIWQFPLCYRCHIMLHCRFFAGDAFEEYVKLIEAGYQFAAMYKMDFGTLKRDHIATPGSRIAKYRIVEPKGNRVLARCAEGEWLPGDLDSLVKEGMEVPDKPKPQVKQSSLWAVGASTLA